MRASLKIKSQFAWCTALAMLLLLPGCGGSNWKASTYPVHGKITINGEAPKGAMVKLIKLGDPVDSRKSDCWALVQEDGSYSFSTYEVGDGVPAGEYAWIIRWPKDSMQLVPDKLGEKYWNLEEPYMTVTVEGQTELPIVELTSVKLN